MGRARKPLNEQKGDLTVERQKQRGTEESMIDLPDDELGTPPKWLISVAAKKEYRRVVKELKKADNLVCNLDQNNIAAYCNAFSQYLAATEALKSTDLLVLKSGEAVENPLVNTQKKYADEMRKFGNLCGLSIDSRLKMAATKRNKIETEIDDVFGNI
mgnify:CR=1 FL=1